jgi:regulator of nucleoside diphosphate kinase
MNSSVRVSESETGKKELYTLVFPEEANISRGLLSVLAPVGIALLGHRKGDLIEARVPGGIRRLRIERVTQTGSLKEKFAADRPTIKLNLTQETGLAG